MAHPPLQPGWIDAPHQRLELGDFALESGETIRDFELSYVVHGTMNATRSNVILGVTAIGSTHHRLDFLIGPGRALDTGRYCVIMADAIGNGLTTSPSTSRRQPGEAFPRFAIRDMVESQRRLLDHLEIETLHAAVGASMGGMQILQWAVSHPQRLARAIAMVPMARTAPWSAAVNEASRRALMADPEWATGPARKGWHAWTAVMQALAGRNPAGLALDCVSVSDTIAWIEQRWQAHGKMGASAVDWIWQTYAYDAHDVAATPGFSGDLAAALATVEARTLVVAAPDDLYNPTAAAREAASLIPNARYAEIPSLLGHQAASGSRPEDAAFLNREIAAFLTA
jgi:homoserine O-acetyltransferase/O-succinyltransferase